MSCIDVQICERVNLRSSLSAGIIYQVYYFEFFGSE